jgi:hypothetical protein
LFHGASQEIQQLPYQHIVKWLPSKLRSKDPGSDDCLDIQVETVNGRKDLRMRCQSVAAVNTIITDIRTTVQVVLLGRALSWKGWVFGSTTCISNKKTIY